MPPTDDFCLKWNDHHSVFFNSAERLCRTELLTDVTLSCGGREFAAHKLVLSVCSGYFAGLFTRRQRQNQHPAPYPVQTIIYLKDVDPRHMELILDYMYRGEINVQEQDLMGLLSTAKSLQIKGLTDASSSGADDSSKQFKSGKPKETAKAAKRLAPEDQSDDDIVTAAIKRVKDESAAAAGPSNTLAVTVDDNGQEVDASEPMPPRSTGRTFPVEEEGFVEEYGGEEFDDDEEGYGESGGAVSIFKLPIKDASTVGKEASGDYAMGSRRL